MAKKFKLQIPDKLKSRKLWLALLSAVFPVLNEQLEWGMDSEVVVTALTGLWIWVIGEFTRDSVRELKN